MLSAERLLYGGRVKSCFFLASSFSEVFSLIYGSFFSLNRYQLSRTGSEGVSEVRWVFPIQGIPESQPIKESYGAVIECKARDRLEERIEVTLAGVAPVTSGPQRSIYTRSITPKNESPKLPDGIVVGESKKYFFLSQFLRKYCKLLYICVIFIL